MKLSNKRVLVVVAHTDDETFGCGGFIKKLSKKKNTIGAISFTDGLGSRSNFTLKKIEKRKEASINASKILGFNWLAQYNYPDNELDKVSLLEIVKIIEKHKKKFKPHIVLTHNFSDLNIDHRVVANAALTAFRPQPMENCREIRLFEIASATDYGNSAITGSFAPNLFVDISNNWDLKKEALLAYCDEMRDYPHSRSIEGIKNLAKIRGNQVGLYLAEAFQVIRKLEI